MTLYAFVFLGAAAVALLMTPLVTRLAYALKLVDRPGVRKVHTSAVPRIGHLEGDLRIAARSQEEVPLRFPDLFEETALRRVVRAARFDDGRAAGVDEEERALSSRRAQTLVDLAQAECGRAEVIQIPVVRDEESLALAVGPATRHAVTGHVDRDERLLGGVAQHVLEFLEEVAAQGPELFVRAGRDKEVSASGLDDAALDEVLVDAAGVVLAEPERREAFVDIRVDPDGNQPILCLFLIAFRLARLARRLGLASVRAEPRSTGQDGPRRQRGRDKGGQTRLHRIPSERRRFHRLHCAWVLVPIANKKSAAQREKPEAAVREEAPGSWLFVAIRGPNGKDSVWSLSR